MEVVAVVAGFGVTAEGQGKKDVATTRLEKFDELDFEGFSKANWDLFHRSRDIR